MAIVVVLGAWLLLSPAKSEEPALVAATEARRDAKYVIRMTPDFYLPGTAPMGVGEKLRAFDDVAREYEALHPDTRIEFVSAPTTMREWLVTQLSSGRAPDIIQVNVEDVWQDTHKGWYVALDPFLDAPNPYVDPGAPGSVQWWDVFKYEEITRGKAGPDGKMYCISFDMVETGIFYNKTMFARLGLREPQTWEEYLALMRTLRENDIVPFLSMSRLYGDWGIDLIFDQVYAEILPGIDVLKDPAREGYLQGYLDTEEIVFLREKGFFTERDPRWREVWRLLKQWPDTSGRGSLSSDLGPFVNQRAAMIWNSSTLVQRFAEGESLDFEWGVFYPPSMTRETSPYASGVPMCVIGGSAMQYVVTSSAMSDTGDPTTSERLRRAVGFLQFITTPRNNARIVNEVAMFLPNVKGVEPRPELLPFDEILKRPYTTTKWTYTFDLKFNDIVMRMLALYLAGGTSDEEFLAWMSRNVEMASRTYERRRGLNREAMERSWRELAPLRAGYQGLPTPADAGESMP